MHLGHRGIAELFLLSFPQFPAAVRFRTRSSGCYMRDPNLGVALLNADERTVEGEAPVAADATVASKIMSWLKVRASNKTAIPRNKAV